MSYQIIKLFVYVISVMLSMWSLSCFNYDNIIHKGKVVASGTIEQLKKDYQKDTLEDLFIECIGGNNYE